MITGYVHGSQGHGGGVIPEQHLWGAVLLPAPAMLSLAQPVGPGISRHCTNRHKALLCLDPHWSAAAVLGSGQRSSKDTYSWGHGVGSSVPTFRLCREHLWELQHGASAATSAAPPSFSQHRDWALSSPAPQTTDSPGKKLH